VLSHVVMGTAESDSIVTGTAAVGVIVLIGLAACLIPARRASRTSPMQALRQD
jgi:ABC-type antimicrobial peptide transport system permease subunit